MIALVWNGVLGFFIFDAFRDPVWGFSSIFFFLFMIPFVLIGLVLILGVAQSFLGLFNPVFEIAMSTGAITRGKGVDIAWEIKGNQKRIERLRIVAVGTETATYTRGTDTVTDTSHFGLVPIVETTETEEISFGSQTITIPTDAVHTFKDSNNEIFWAIQVRADIPLFPDVFQTHIFRVKP